jgi:hypothetical protein
MKKKQYILYHRLRNKYYARIKKTYESLGYSSSLFVCDSPESAPRLTKWEAKRARRKCKRLFDVYLEMIEVE